MYLVTSSLSFLLLLRLTFTRSMTTNTLLRHSPSNAPLYWGIIGCGDVTERKSGPTAFNVQIPLKNDGMVSHNRLLAVMRRSANLAADYAHRHGVPKSYDSVDDLLGDPDINAVYIATPPSSHKEYTLRALAAGLAVYCEKPVTRNYAEALELQDIIHHPEKLSSLSGTPLSGIRRIPLVTVAHYRRALPMYIRVKELIESGCIGSVKDIKLRCWQAKAKPKPKPLLEATSENRPKSEEALTQDANNADASGWRLDPAVSGGGYFHDLSPHQLDLMLYFFGRPLHCRAQTADPASTTHTYQEKHSTATGDTDGINSNIRYTERNPKTRVLDEVYGEADFPCGVHFSGSWRFAMEASEEEADDCNIIGSAGSLHFGFFGSGGTIRVEGCVDDSNIRAQSTHDCQGLAVGAISEGSSDVIVNGASPSSTSICNSTRSWVEHFEHPETIQAPMLLQTARYFHEPDSIPNPCSIDDACIVMNMMDVFTN